MADVIKNRSNNHLYKYDLGKVKTGLAKSRDAATQSVERNGLWRHLPAEVQASGGVWLVAAAAGSCKEAESLTNGTYQKEVARGKKKSYYRKMLGKKYKTKDWNK